jgi:hypothetical protein
VTAAVNDPSAPRRPRWTALAVLVISTAFIAAPTPGDVGGCGGANANVDIPGSQSEAEYDYFDQGMCSHLCFRLRECGVLCRSNSGAGPDCTNDSEPAFIQCIRGNIRQDIFGTNACPHSCGTYQGEFCGAFQGDITACGHAIEETSCGGLPDVIRNPPTSCTALCRNVGTCTGAP